jgi:predicted DNA-binding transcriptional regulator YafY
MSKKAFFLRYTLELKRLRQGRASLKELSEYIDSNAEYLDEGISLSKRTFQRDMKDIRTIFNYDIQYDRKSRSYFIDNVDKSANTDRMLEAFEMFNALNLTDDLLHFIHVEKRKPQGTHHFHGLLHCIKNHFVVNFPYHKYDDDIIVKREVEPYALKEFKSRWYLIAKDQHDKYVKTFGLDRIQELNITKKKFAPPDNFDANDLYKDYFGIVNTATDKAEEIILSFDNFNGKYIKSFPLHESQQILVDNENETRIKLFLHATFDFEIELLSHGDRVKVVAPDSLRKRMREIYNNALNKNKD